MTAYGPGAKRLAVLATLASLTLTGCAADPTPASSSSVSTAAQDVAEGTGVWDASTVHEISVDVDEDAVAAMIDTYQDSGEKEWIEATVTIDGETYERAGLRLKGNSSLRGVTDDADPTDLPWLIRLDEFVDDQSVDGWSDFIVRSNGSQTALNEAVALDLLAEAGLASEHAIPSSFSVNGADARLRLVVQNLDEEWEAENFSTDGLLYKAEAGGDWSYRGDDPDSYTDVFDQETGDDDLTPLIDFLQFVNESSDEDFAAELPERLDVESFARYLAFEDLVGNFDDIDGPGNNAYLRWDAESGGFTVVAWDHNLAFGGSPGGMGGGMGGGPGGGFGGSRGERPEGMPEMPDGERPEGMPGGMPEGGPGGGMPGGSNVLVERFTAVDEWAALVEQAGADLTEQLVDSGYAEEVLDRWAGVLTAQAGDLVDATTVQEEADAIRASLS
jgi:spore coat protein CotH